MVAKRFLLFWSLFGAVAALLMTSPNLGYAEASPRSTPFTDHRQERPGAVHHITLADLPAPYATKSVDNGPELIPRPANAWPQAPAGFKVQLYADGLENPRLIRTAPNGDVFLAESAAGEVKVFRGITASGKAEQVQIFATGLNKPFGIAFSPLGPNPEWVYVANTDSVVRFPYRNGDLKARRTAGSRAKFAWWRALARWRPLDSRYRIFTRRQEDVRIGWIAHQRRREQ